MASNTVPFLRDTLSRTTFPACGLTLDIGRQRMTEADFNSLLEIAREKGVLGANAAMREGQIVNASEGRAALHTALRDPAVGAPFHKEVQEALEHMCAFADDVRSGRRRGCRGDTITDVINVGIGGSEVGPRRFIRRFARPANRCGCTFWLQPTACRLTVSWATSIPSRRS